MSLELRGCKWCFYCRMAAGRCSKSRASRRLGPFQPISAVEVQFSDEKQLEVFTAALAEHCALARQGLRGACREAWTGQWRSGSRGRPSAATDGCARLTLGLGPEKAALLAVGACLDGTEDDPLWYGKTRKEIEYATELEKSNGNAASREGAADSVAVSS